jgi:AraC-like DNA-binding protein
MTPRAQWLEPSFHPTYARLLCVLLRKRGVETQQLLAGTGLSWTTLLDGNRGIGFAQIRGLILAAIKLANAPALGMELGAATPVSAHGQVGYAAVASKDLAQVIDVLIRYGALRSNAVDFRLTRYGTQCHLQIREQFDLGDVRIPILETVLVIVVHMIETLLGFPLEQVQYYLPYPAPTWHPVYSSRLKGEINFNAACLEMRLPAELLAAPCLTADALAYASARRDCEQGLEQVLLDSSVVHQVRVRLQGREGSYPSCDAMAAELHMSTRTLIRKLKLCGTSYQALLDDVRKELGQWYLAHTSYPVELIAERLGYLDTSNFSRTFRRWFGISPTAYRGMMGARRGPVPGQ